MKSYFKMKYEQFLMRAFDLIVALLSKTRMDWWPKYILGCDELEDKIYDLEQELDDMRIALEMSYHVRDIYEDYIDEFIEKQEETK